MFEEKSQHLGGGVGAGWVGVGPGRVATEPGVCTAVHDPLLGHDWAFDVAVHLQCVVMTVGAAVGGRCRPLRCGVGWARC